MRVQYGWGGESPKRIGGRDMIARQARDRRLQTAAEALGIGFFYLGVVAFFVYTLSQVLESGLL